MIHQELSRSFIALSWKTYGRPRTINKFGFVDHKQMYKQSLDVLKEIELMKIRGR